MGPDALRIIDVGTIRREAAQPNRFFQTLMPRLAASRILLPALLLLAIGSATVWRCYCGQGVELRLRNGTPQPLTNIRIEVTGRSYQLHRIDAHAEAFLRIEPTSESDITLVVDGSDTPLVVDTYLEPGYAGFLTVQIDSEGAQIVEEEIEIRGC